MLLATLPSNQKSRCQISQELLSSSRQNLANNSDILGNKQGLLLAVIFRESISAQL